MLTCQAEFPSDLNRFISALKSGPLKPTNIVLHNNPNELCKVPAPTAANSVEASMAASASHRITSATSREEPSEAGSGEKTPASESAPSRPQRARAASLRAFREGVRISGRLPKLPIWRQATARTPGNAPLRTPPNPWGASLEEGVLRSSCSDARRSAYRAGLDRNSSNIWIGWWKRGGVGCGGVWGGGCDTLD